MSQLPVAPPPIPEPAAPAAPLPAPPPAIPFPSPEPASSGSFLDGHLWPDIETAATAAVMIATWVESWVGNLPPSEAAWVSAVAAGVLSVAKGLTKFGNGSQS